MSEQTDRELLELAAKAVGLPLSSEWDAADEGILVGTGDGDLKVWNPLTDDGDALRLAVKLWLFVDKNFIDKLECALTYPGDPCATTRRAIVRAAAAIGATK